MVETGSSCALFVWQPANDGNLLIACLHFHRCVMPYSAVPRCFELPLSLT